MPVDGTATSGGAGVGARSWYDKDVGCRGRGPRFSGAPPQRSVNGSPTWSVSVRGAQHVPLRTWRPGFARRARAIRAVRSCTPCPDAANRICAHEFAHWRDGDAIAMAWAGVALLCRCVWRLS